MDDPIMSLQLFLTCKFTWTFVTVMTYLLVDDLHMFTKVGYAGENFPTYVTVSRGPLAYHFYHQLLLGLFFLLFYLVKAVVYADHVVRVAVLVVVHCRTRGTGTAEEAVYGPLMLVEGFLAAIVLLTQVTHVRQALVSNLQITSNSLTWSSKERLYLINIFK